MNKVTQFLEDSERAKAVTITVLSFFRAAADEVFADGQIIPDETAVSAGTLAGRALRTVLGTSGVRLYRDFGSATDVAEDQE